MNFPPLEQFSKLEAFQLALNLLLSCLLAAFGFNLSNLADSYRDGRQILQAVMPGGGEGVHKTIMLLQSIGALD